MLCLPVFLFTPDDDILDDINAHLASNAAHMTTDHVRAQMHVLASFTFNRNNFTHEHCTVHKVHVHVHMYTCTYVYYSYYLCICLSSKLNIVLKLNTSHLICMHMYVQYMYVYSVHTHVVTSACIGYTCQQFHVANPKNIGLHLKSG